MQPGFVHSASTLRLSLRLGTGGCCVCVCVVRVGRRSVGGRRDDCESLRGAVVESLRDSGWRGALWALWALWVLSRRLWDGREGFWAGVGDGFAGRTGGPRWDEAEAALAAESALLMPATDWLEYPESLLPSMLAGTLPVGVLSGPMSPGLERLVRTFALPGDGSGVKGSMDTPWPPWPSSEK